MADTRTQNASRKTPTEYSIYSCIRCVRSAPRRLLGRQNNPVGTDDTGDMRTTSFHCFHVTGKEKGYVTFMSAAAFHRSYYEADHVLGHSATLRPRALGMALWEVAEQRLTERPRKIVTRRCREDLAAVRDGPLPQPQTSNIRGVDGLDDAAPGPSYDVERQQAYRWSTSGPQHLTSRPLSTVPQITTLCLPCIESKGNCTRGSPKQVCDRCMTLDKRHRCWEPYPPGTWALPTFTSKQIIKPSKKTHDEGGEFCHLTPITAREIQNWIVYNSDRARKISAEVDGSTKSEEGSMDIDQTGKANVQGEQAVDKAKASAHDIGDRTEQQRAQTGLRVTKRGGDVMKISSMLK